MAEEEDVEAVIAESYARIFYRNSVDGGFFIPLEAKQKLTEEILEALGHAHGQGLVHRDLKPANVLLDGERLGPVWTYVFNEVPEPDRWIPHGDWRRYLAERGARAPRS